MDQGRDAVFVRDILRGHHTLEGPSASIEGIFTGPLWYYLLAMGFFMSGGHPAAGPLILLTINLATVILLAIVLKRKLGKLASLLISGSLVFSASFFETSLFAFNPFLLVSLTLVMILSLSLLSHRRQWLFLVACLSAGLSAHSQIASTLPLVLLVLTAAGVYLYRKVLSLEFFLLGLVTLAIPFIPHYLSEIQSNFSQLRAGLAAFQSSDAGVAVGATSLVNHLFSTAVEFLSLLGISVVFQSVMAGLIVIAALLFLSWRNKSAPKSKFSARFIKLSVTLWIINFFWFSASTGLQDWHLVGLPPLVIVSVGLLLQYLPQKIKVAALLGFVALQLSGSIQRAVTLRADTSDPSLLVNELAAIDWTYQQSNGQSFAVYSYLPSIKDYPYQYLYWWHGQETYDRLPCRYAVDSLGASSYVPHAREYQQADRSCSGLVYLIIEPPVHQHLQDQWREYVARGTTLVETTRVGKITVEKRMR